MFSVVILFHHLFPLLEKVEIRAFILPRNFPAVLIIFTGRGGAGNPPSPQGGFPAVRGVHPWCPILYSFVSCVFCQGITHQIQFSLDGLRGIRWENSKRLIYGSLVCLSHDRFSSLLFGTIANRDAKNLKEGRIDVFFQGTTDSDLCLQRTYTMVESSTYFEVSTLVKD